MSKKYRKKPVIIEAIKWTGNNISDIIKFTKNDSKIVSIYGKDLTIKTLEGTMKADCGDYIIKGVKGEFYPCKPDIFEQTYEEIEHA